MIFGGVIRGRGPITPRCIGCGGVAENIRFVKQFDICCLPSESESDSPIGLVNVLRGVGS